MFGADPAHLVLQLLDHTRSDAPNQVGKVTEDSDPLGLILVLDSDSCPSLGLLA